MTAKRRHTLTLDIELVEFLTADGAPLSSTVNQILADEVGRQRRQAGLRRLLDDLEAEIGPADPDEVERFKHLMS